MWWTLGIILAVIALPAVALLVVFVLASLADEQFWEEIELEEQERRDGLRSNE